MHFAVRWCVLKTTTFSLIGLWHRECLLNYNLSGLFCAVFVSVPRISVWKIAVIFVGLFALHYTVKLVLWSDVMYSLWKWIAKWDCKLVVVALKFIFQLCLHSHIIKLEKDSIPLWKTIVNKCILNKCSDIASDFQAKKQTPLKR